MEEPQQPLAAPSPSDRSAAENSLRNHPSPCPPSSTGVANCYVFKSRLQEYAQKVGIPTPVYQTLKEGPSHEPVFKSTVIVNNVKYESLPGFFNRKAAEQSAAEVALVEMYKLGQMTESIPTVHESGLCKNLLQEYAQKMNYAIPSYKCNRQEEGAHPFICTVEIGGIQYIGAAARTKKEAEIKAARIALLAIKGGTETGANGASQYTVLPTKKKGREQQESRPKSAEQLKPKKAKMKKKWPKSKFLRNKGKKGPNDNADGSLAPVGTGEDASMAPNATQDEQQPVGMKDELLGQSDELKTSAMGSNGSANDESTALRSETVPETLPEMKTHAAGDIADRSETVPETLPEMKTHAAGNIADVRSEE